MMVEELERSKQMSRIKLETHEELTPKKAMNTLESLIPEYGEQNTRCNALKKTVADLNAKIKDAIRTIQKENLDIEVEGWKCKLSVSEDVQVNEAQLIEVLKSYDVPVIKTKEYVDAEALESLIYANKLSEEILLAIDKCNTKTKKEVLRCTKVKAE